MRNLFAALLALPNLAAAFSTTSMLFIPGGIWNQNQRLVSEMGSDATATTWAVTCTANPTATTKCDIASPYMIYTIGVSTMKMSNTQSQAYDIACTLTSTVGGFCSGHVTGVAFSTALDKNYLTNYGYREVTVTDSFASSTSSSIASTTISSSSSTPPKTSSSSSSSSVKSTVESTVTSSSLVAPTSIPSGVLISYALSGSSIVPTKTSANGGLGGGASESKIKNLGAPPMVTGAMRMMAAAAVVGGAVGL